METVKPTRKAGIVIQDIGGETMLYSSDDKAVHVLNATAQLIWELCDGDHSLAEMEQAIRSQFAVPAEAQVLKDVERTLSIFASKGLLQ
jgi:hypothetical protein